MTKGKKLGFGLAAFFGLALLIGFEVATESFATHERAEAPPAGALSLKGTVVNLPGRFACDDATGTPFCS